MLKDTVRRIVKRYDRAYWLDCARALRFPGELWEAMSDSGLLGLGVPEEFGGVGLGLREMVIVSEELARGRASDDLYGRGGIRLGKPLGTRGEHGKAARVRSRVGRCGCCTPVPRRYCLCSGDRHFQFILADPPVSKCAGEQRDGSELHWAEHARTAQVVLMIEGVICRAWGLALRARVATATIVVALASLCPNL